MWNTFKYTLLSTLRERGVIIWVVLFPLILATLFNAMFAGIEETAYSLRVIPVAVVDNSEDGAGKAFDETMKALSEGDDPLVSVTKAKTADEAFALLKSGDVVGTITVAADGEPSLQVSPGGGDMGLSMSQVERTVLADVVDDFCRSSAAANDIVENDPMALANPKVIESFSDRAKFTANLTITHSKTREYVRYFYALLGFAAVMAASVGLNAMARIQPNVSPLGARRVVSGTGRGRMLAGAMAASWVVSFCALMLAFCYIRFALGVSFGGREWYCVLGLAVSALMATAFGAILGSLPKIPVAAKSGLLTAIVCLFSLFAGLYGTPALRLADQVAREAPWAATVNPVKQVTDLFYCLYVYTDMEPFFQTIGVLLVLTVVFALVAALFMRRQRYASL